MAVNKFKPHIFVIPEDDANRQIANGFMLHSSVDSRTIQIMPVAGGWSRVCDEFVTKFAPRMHNNSNTHVILQIDFDEDVGRLERVKQIMTPELLSRVMVIGAKSNPEALRDEARWGSFEDIGKALADDCWSGAGSKWTHDLLKHNEPELNRIGPVLRQILFPH